MKERQFLTPKEFKEKKKLMLQLPSRVSDRRRQLIPGIKT